MSLWIIYGTQFRAKYHRGHLLARIIAKGDYPYEGVCRRFEKYIIAR